MITRIRLGNFKTFAPDQTAELSPITVIVGANNSGKSNFLRFPDFVRTVDFNGFWHRPANKHSFVVGWDCEPNPIDGLARSYTMTANRAQHLEVIELLRAGANEIFRSAGIVGSNAVVTSTQHGHVLNAAVGTAGRLFVQGQGNPVLVAEARQAMSPVIDARYVHLKLEKLSHDIQLQKDPKLAVDGSNLASVIANWLLEYPDKLARFNEYMRRCLPELKTVHARCVLAGQVRLHFEQTDGERFDSTEVSDGVLVFAGLIAHALEAPPNALMMIEEPERGLHPRRLSELVELLRILVEERGTQFILATHAPAMLNLFRDEPEAILMMSRRDTGTVIRRLSDDKELAESLSRTDPGEMLAAGAFNEAESTKP